MFRTAILLLAASALWRRRPRRQEGQAQPPRQVQQPLPAPARAQPVNWHPWGEDAFAKAKKENKLVFLSIGYSACHWCHVMEKESFSNEEVAKYLNGALRLHQGGPRGAAGRG